EIASLRHLLPKGSNDVPQGSPPRLLEEGGSIPDRGLGADRGRGRGADVGAPRAGGGRGTRPLSPDRDLFGQEVAPPGPAQGSLLPELKAPQGLSRAVEEARATVSALQRKVHRAQRRSTEVRRFHAG